MKSNFLRKLWLSVITLMLCSAAFGAGTQYCDTEMTSTVGWNGNYNLTIKKAGPLQTTIIISVGSTQEITGLYNFDNQGGGGVLAQNGKSFEISSDKHSATLTLTWTTYPSSAAKFYMVFNRNTAKGGGSDIFGNTVENIDASAVCTPASDPVITVDPTSLAFTATGSKTITVTGANLTGAITAESSNASFTADASSLTLEGGTLTVTCSATTNTSGTITLSSDGADDVEIPVSFSLNTECKGTDSQAMAGQGSFTDGYNYDFSTSGTSVTISFELLDNKSDVSAYLWNYTSGSMVETGMTTSGKKGTISLTNQTIGSTLTFACKFGYAGGMAVTKQFTYTVGNDCTPKITADVSESIFTAKDQVNTITVTGSSLSSAVSYVVSSDRFQVTESSLTTAGGTVKVKYVSAEATANETITFSSGSATPVVVALKAQSSNPTITVDKSSLTVMSDATQKFTITAQDLTEAVSISCDNADFSFDPTEGAQSGNTDITVSYNGKQLGATGTVTLSSTGAASKTVTLTGYYNTECSGFNNQASDGSFSVGYTYNFVTNGDDVTCTFELLDNKNIAVAYLWDQTPGHTFETAMSVSGKTATVTLADQTIGSTLTIACKFDVGSVLATKYFTYTVGHTCQPTIFTDKESMTFDAPNVEQALVVTSEALTADITATITSGSFSLDKSSVSSTGGTFNVTYTGSESTDSGSLKLSSTGATDKVIPLSVVLPVPEITVSTSAMTFVSTSTASAAAQTFTVSGANLKSDLTISCDNTDAFTINKTEVPQSGESTEVTVTFKGSENATGTITISGTDATSKTVTLTGYYNTACSGYLVATADANTLPLTYSVAETPAGQFVIQYKFSRSVVGIAPQIYFEDTNKFRDMTYQGDNTYSLTTDDEAVTAATFRYKAYCPSSSEGTYQTETTTYTKGSCDVQLIKAGDKSYSTLAAALADYTTGSTLVVFGDVNESNTIAEHVKINASGFNIGSITIETTGKLEFETGNASIKTLIIKSVPNVGAGQIVRNEKTITAEETYMERQLFSGSYEKKWYSIGVPFAVSTTDGFYTSAGKKISSGVYIDQYNGANRAEYGVVSRTEDGYAWIEDPITLQRGIGYMIYVTSGAYSTVRFKATDPNELFTVSNSIDYEFYSGEVGAKHNGWNFLSQPCIQNASAGITKGTWHYIQVLTNGGTSTTPNCYQTFDVTGTVIMAPFTAFMFQSTDDGTMNFTTQAGSAEIKSAEAVEKDYFEVTLYDANGGSDNTFVGASESAKADGYEIGKDLLKCGNSTTTLQICTTEFDEILTVNQAKAYDGVADLALVLSIPSAGNYSLKVTDFADNGDIFLTKDGDVIADLTDGEAYEFASAKGVNKQYGLRIVLDEDFATDATDADAEASVYANDGVIYVNGVKAAEVMNLMGQRVANPVAEGGIYLVNAGGKYVKINVQ